MSQIATFNAEAYEDVVAGRSLMTKDELFAYQVEALHAANLMLYTDANQLRRSLSRASSGLFLVSPVRPHNQSLDDLMKKVVVNGVSGVSRLPADEAYSLTSPRATSFILSGVEDGRSFVGKGGSPLDHLASIAEDRRGAYDLWRGIVHAIVFPWVLTRHFLFLSGTEVLRFVPRLYLDHHGVPTLGADSSRNADPRFGSMSYHQVVR